MVHMKQSNDLYNVIYKISCTAVLLCVCFCLSICVLSLGKKMNRQEDQKHIFLFGLMRDSILAIV